MSSYYRYLAAGLNRVDPIWTEPYKDKTGLGDVTTTAFPVYDRTLKPHFLLGVVGIDITMDQFYKFDNSKKVLKKLVTQSIKCTKTTFTECDLEALRVNKCGNSCSHVSTKPASCSSSITSSELVCGNDILHKSVSNVQKCCGKSTCSSNSKTTIIVVAIVVPLVIILLIVIVYFVNRKRVKFEKEREIQRKEYNGVIKHNYESQEQVISHPQQQNFVEKPYYNNPDFQQPNYQQQYNQQQHNQQHNQQQFNQQQYNQQQHNQQQYNQQQYNLQQNNQQQNNQQQYNQQHNQQPQYGQGLIGQPY